MTRKPGDEHAGTGPGNGQTTGGLRTGADTTSRRKNLPGGRERNNHDRDADWDLGQGDAEA